MTTSGGHGAPSTRKGWLHTGDLGLMRETVHSPDRAPKDMIIRGGENVYPREVEDFCTPTPRCQSAVWEFRMSGWEKLWWRGSD